MTAKPLNSASEAEGVILLHGLCRRASCMDKMAKCLSASGYMVVNYDYPSRTNGVAELCQKVIGGALKDERIKGCKRIHFVTHSLGGILVRAYFHQHVAEKLGRVVMLGPPNQGSEVVDRLGGWRLFKAINGPAGKEMGTKSDSMPNSLGKANFELGIIAGDRSINWINSLMISGADDGKVSVERTKVDGMKEHVTIHTTHPFLMKNDRVIKLTIQFLRTGSFQS